MKRISILGSTGSVGSQIVEVVSRFYKDTIEVDALSCRSSYLLLAQQALDLSPKRVFISEESAYPKLKQILSSTNIEVICDRSGDIGNIFADNDMLIVATSGIEGLLPMYDALSYGIPVATSNKDGIVCGGKLLLPYVDKISPLDSEHYAINELLRSRDPKLLKGITLTASGGPFFRKKKSGVGIADALSHPVWKMGKKNSVDSATLVNKILEVIEAHYLFRISKEDISILIHPEAIIHGMADFLDGSQHAFISSPDMKIGINSTLSRLVGGSAETTQKYANISLIGKNLTFYPAEIEEFPVLKFLRTGQEITFNVANDLAVSEFLYGRIAFHAIPDFIAAGMESFHYNENSINNIDDVLATYNEAKQALSNNNKLFDRRRSAVS
ncbi:1-deoxy-D-xylulose 5-phosphate reductoisomerase family protein [Neorickettsia helminthoeca str. Oregon]|uniref:1-deoxy-D-xylulose 5-phosphate reductoisomerase n=1 Tax=Neorickettsia helminthoeca str. Oregon TaxID=1286528 RepID=X5H3T9_9RICK|nr:1-deoxy-D-xylulose-5-phosphate reductoisomerase [Neorickettsia helminthoeca]AHX11363.1 1-deoxy-D-xylulose 5-phosphate reductoisomerase family protein [Neorickettsia helminthoeca str. Oregon]